MKDLEVEADTRAPTFVSLSNEINGNVRAGKNSSPTSLKPVQNQKKPVSNGCKATSSATLKNYSAKNNFHDLNGDQQNEDRPDQSIEEKFDKLKEEKSEKRKIGTKEVEKIIVKCLDVENEKPERLKPERSGNGSQKTKLENEIVAEVNGNNPQELEADGLAGLNGLGGLNGLTTDPVNGQDEASGSTPEGDRLEVDQVVEGLDPADPVDPADPEHETNPGSAESDQQVEEILPEDCQNLEPETLTEQLTEPEQLPLPEPQFVSDNTTNSDINLPEKIDLEPGQLQEEVNPEDESAKNPETSKMHLIFSARRLSVIIFKSPLQPSGFNLESPVLMDPHLCPTACRSPTFSLTYDNNRN